MAVTQNWHWLTVAGQGASFQTSCLFFPGRKAGIVRLHHQSWHWMCSTCSLLPRLLAVPAVTPEVRWAAETAHFSSPKGVGPFLCASRSVFVTPCAVPTGCIKRGRRPLRQARWHLSHVQNLLLELFVVKLKAALEISTPSLPIHRRSR